MERLKQARKALIFNTLDRIEDRSGVMAHEDERIKEKLRTWQDGNLKDSYFQETLNKYLDELNEQGE